MSFHLFDAPHPDTSSITAFAGNKLNRLAEKREPDSAKKALEDPNAKIMLIADRDAILWRSDPENSFGLWFSKQDLDEILDQIEEAVLLGHDKDNTAILAVPSIREKPEESETVAHIDLRSLYIQGLLDTETLGALAQGAALVAWNASHKFCSRCGHESALVNGGYKRQCSNCGAEHFPRTDPVVIMLTVTPDNQRCLLGRSPHFPEGMYSCLAGFVEPGETLEDAMRRETVEESGVVVGRVAYHASQPWPFPYSIMIGMYGEAEDETLSIDDELEDARWFDREEVKLMISGEHPDGLRMPPRGAIAWRLVEDWVVRG